MDGILKDTIRFADISIVSTGRFVKSSTTCSAKENIWECKPQARSRRK